MNEHEYTTRFWNEASAVYDRILDLPFNQELMCGTLDRDKFVYYIKQDALYLADFGRALAIAGTQTEDAEEMKLLLRFAEEAIVVERALHDHYLKEFDTDLDIPKSPTCEAYTGYLIRAATLEPWPVALAALLPCFWIYREVGNHIHKNATKPNVYQEWIDTYASEEFSESVDQAIALTEHAAHNTTEVIRDRMQNAYLKSTRLEWLFWDAAWRMEQWPV